MKFTIENIIAAFLALVTAFFGWKNSALSKQVAVFQEQQAKSTKEQSLTVGQLEHETLFRQDLIAEHRRDEETIERLSRELSTDRAEIASERARNDILLESMKRLDADYHKERHDKANLQQQLMDFMEIALAQENGSKDRALWLRLLPLWSSKLTTMQKEIEGEVL